jgi:pimeloyl-ACP methyl ester carboxylesterase
MTINVRGAAEAGFLDVNGARLEFAWAGPPPDAAPTIVLLHEGLGCVALWRDFPEKLAAATGFGVLVYSRLGYGRSSPVALPRPLDYMTREAVDSLPRVLDAAGVGRTVLVGHSDGATIAAIYAGAVDDSRLLGIALIAPHFFAEGHGLRAIRAAERAFAEGDLKPRLAKYHADVEGAFHGWSRAWLDPEFERWSVAEYIDRWRVPALVVQGEDDAYGTLKQVEEIRARARVGSETLVLPGCGHAPQFERPAETLAAVAAFCRRAAA